MQSSQAEQAKEFGNACLAKGKLDAAIAAYSEAICLAPHASYYTNRALALKRKCGAGWHGLVCADCRSALRLDDKSIKAHYMLGCTLSELGDFSLATEHLRRALGLTAQTSVSYASEIRRAMLAANKRRWESERDRTLSAYEATQPLLDALATRLLADEPHEQRAEQLATVGRAFADSRAALSRAQQVPDYLCCAISLDLLEDPVITPCGLTYERSCIVEHLRSNGPFDPVSRKPLGLHQLVPNLGMKAAVEAFLAANPWAWGSL